MNVLLDTCALLALATGNLPPTAAEALKAAPRAILSPVIPWEIAIKVKSGKLTLPDAPLSFVFALVRRYQLDPPSGHLDATLLCAAADLPLIHRDPFDRVLIATALRMNFAILTSDRLIPSYPGVIAIW